jgi:hypothetical protein
MKKSMVGLALCAALFALGLSACDASLPSSDDGESIFTTTSDAKKGNLTINDISSSQSGSWYAYISASDTLTGSIKPDDYVARSYESISSDASTVSLHPLSSSSSRWSGGESYYVYLVTSSKIVAKSNKRISFSDGNGTASASDFVSGLKITGITSTSSLNGSYYVYLHTSSSTSSPKYGCTASSSSSVTINSSTGGATTVPLYSGSGSSSQWGNTGSYYVYLVDSSDRIVAKSRSEVSFALGNAEISTSASAAQLTFVGLTITNTSDSSLNGKSYQVYISSNSSPTNLSSNASATGSVAISSSTATVFLSYNTNSQWLGSGSYYVYFVDSSSQSATRSNGSVSFSFGSGTINASTLGQTQTATGLKMTGITSSSGLDGSYGVYISSSSSVTSFASSSNYEASSSSSVAINSATTEATFTLYSRSSPSLLWTDTGSYYYVYLVDSSNRIVAKSRSQVSFDFGSGTINASSGLAFLGLKITNISSIPYGTYRVYINTNSNTSSPGSSPAANGSVTISSSTDSSVTVLLYSGSNSSPQWVPSSGYSNYVYLVNSSNQIVAKSNKAFYFTNGGDTINASSELAFLGLKITNITDSLYGTWRVYIHSRSTNSPSSSYVASSSSSVSIGSSTGSTAIVPLYNNSSSQWTGSGGSSYYVYLADNSSPTTIKSSGPITFTSGNGTISANNLK